MVTAPAPADEGRIGIAARRQRWAEALVDAALAAQRGGHLDALLRKHPRRLQRATARLAGIVRGTAGEALDGGDSAAPVAALLLRWLAVQLRPDGQGSLEVAVAEAWLNQLAWRPFLAVACHNGWLRVPDFPKRYRRRSDEAALDNLCGLWDVAPSSFYRYLERARQQMAATLLRWPLSVPQRFALRALVLDTVAATLPAAEAAQLGAWQARQARRALERQDAASALWHAWRGGDTTLFLATLRQRTGELAAEPETDALVERLAAIALAPRQQFELWMARAQLARTRSAPERELQAYDKALQLAQAAQDRVLLGVAYGALGKFHEPRDAARAFACYQDSADYLRDQELQPRDSVAIEQYLSTLVRLAWLYVQRSDARSRSVLDLADSLRQRFAVADEVQGMLEQTWGEYWRSSGDLVRCMEHRYRALNIFERLGEQRSVLATCSNLVWVLGETRDFVQAEHYAQRIFDAAQQGTVEPALLASTHINLGAGCFWQGLLDDALVHYQKALAIARQAGLKLHAVRAHFNLAETYFSRFNRDVDMADEQRGDEHVRAVLAASASDAPPDLIGAAWKLKGQVLGGEGQAQAAAMLPGEDAVHYEEMATIRRQRELLAIGGPAEDQVRAHLTIANAYLAVSTQEREAALALVQRHGLQDSFAAEFEQLRSTFERALTREQQLQAQWQQQAGELLDEARRAAVLAALLTPGGALSKSAYAELCGVAPATASKHLATLSERGLLVQSGKGPATRYRLS